MKYTCHIIIELPMTEVIALWQDESNLNHWQDGYVSSELLSGTINTVGAKTKIIFQQGKRKLELTETIISINLPEEKTALYEHIHMTNTQTTRFKALEENKTEFITEVNYTHFNGFVPKALSFLFPRMFKKQSQKWLNQFKTFAENKNS